MKIYWNGLRPKPQKNIAVAAATLIGSIIGAAVSAIGSGINTGLQASTNKQNQKNLETAWSRDDAQLQRARADATAAGFSPLAALSNNLTNTAPGMMQAPQFDSSGIVESIQSGTKNYAEIKAQAPILKQQEKSMKLENAMKSVDLRTRNLQNLANLTKSMKELDGMDLTNYEKASILVANGIPSDTVQTMLKHTTKEKAVKNTSQDYINKLQAAQTTLANEQATTQEKQRALLDAQKALTEIQTTAAENDNKYLNENICTKGNYYTQPDLVKLSNGDYQIQYKKVQAKDDITRREYLAMLNEVIEQIKVHQIVSEINMSDWKKFGTLLGALK